MKSINIEDFAKKYRNNYNWVSIFGDRISEYNELVQSFGVFASTHQEFVSEFCNYIGSRISGGHEAVAFMFTMTDVTELDTDLETTMTTWNHPKN